MERKERMINLRHTGLSYQAIGVLFGISRQRVHQITSGYQQLGISLQSNSWYRKIQEAILERDKYKCQKCGKGETLLVHHCDKDDDNNNIGNLITLCSACHLDLHRPYRKLRGNRRAQ